MEINKIYCGNSAPDSKDTGDKEIIDQFVDKILCGDVLEVLKTLPNNFMDCCICSPPYYGLRDYGVEGQIGLEPTPEKYVAKLVEVFREVKRVLKDEGTLWLNLGDSYSTTKTGNFNGGGFKDTSAINGTRDMSGVETSGKFDKAKACLECGIKPKDLIGIPWMVAFALRADGWYLRSDIIWEKPNCMPESVTDRPTKSHEYMFLLSKSKKYYYDGEAIKEDATGYDGRKDTRMKGSEKYKDGEHFNNNPNSLAVNGCERWPSTINGVPARNKRTVWTIPTRPYKEAHFATFPEALVEPCILAGTSENGCCPACNAPYKRILVKKPMIIKRSERASQMGKFGRTQSSGTMVSPPQSKTIGWQQTCSCILDCAWGKPDPCLVLDPFMGSGTVGVVSKKLGRNFVGIELNLNYIEMANKRIGDTLIGLTKKS